MASPAPAPPPSTSSSPPPAPDLILDLIHAHRASKALFAAVELGVVDVLMQAEPLGMTVEQLAQALEAAPAPHAGGGEACTSAGDGGDAAAPAVTGTLGAEGQTAGGGTTPTPFSRDGLSRLLDACVAIGILARSVNAEGQCTGGTAAVVCRLTAVAREYLASASPHSLAGYVVHCNRLVYPLFQHLEHSVRSGANAWQPAFGMASDAVFRNVYSDEAALLRFMRGMHGFAALSARHVLTAFDLSRFSSALDLGGATGAFMTALAQLHPTCKCTVVDLPHVVEAAKRHFTQPPYVEDPCVLDRISWLAADFFAAAASEQQQQHGQREQQHGQREQQHGQREDQQHGQEGGQQQQRQRQQQQRPLPKCDLYVLTRILHDWDEGRCLQLLRFLHGRMAPGSALLIGEMLLSSADELGQQSNRDSGERGGQPLPVAATAAAHLQDLNMLVQTHGRERDSEGYRRLLAAAGFDPDRVQCKRTGVYLDAIFAER